jgi:hypothetical protein
MGSESTIVIFVFLLSSMVYLKYLMHARTAYFLLSLCFVEMHNCKLKCLLNLQVQLYRESF